MRMGQHEGAILERYQTGDWRDGEMSDGEREWREGRGEFDYQY